MKKYKLALALGVLGLLTSCGNSNASSTSSINNSTANGTIDSAKILVVYFSWSNTTERIANMISTSTGGTLVEIQPATPYTTNYNDVIDIGRDEKANDSRPEISEQTYNSIEMDNYSTIFIGFPIWWYCEPMIIRTFIEHYNGLSNKTIYPFSTASSSSANDAVNNIREKCSEATVSSFLHLTSSSLSRAESLVSSWLNEISLPILPSLASIGEENEKH